MPKWMVTEAETKNEHAQILIELIHRLGTAPKWLSRKLFNQFDRNVNNFYICKGNFSVQFNIYLKSVVWTHWHFVLDEWPWDISLWASIKFSIEAGFYVYIHRFSCITKDWSPKALLSIWPEIDDHNTFPTFYAKK